MTAHSAQWTILFSLCSLLPLGASAGDAIAPQNDQRLLLLRNGQILEGRVSRVEGAHVVELSAGQIRVKDAEVEMVCSNLEEAYQRKRSQVQAGDIYQHLDLVQWCLRHKLHGFAENELASAAQIDPQNPTIAALRHRLAMAQEKPAVAEKAKATQPLISNEELDRMVRNLPHGSVETFTQSVQPVLMNHCMSSGCHGSQAENGLQLYRIQFGKTTSRRLTQRNLHSVLQYVDRDNPTRSRLLAIVSEPHGGQQSAIFSERQAPQYQRLVDWINQTSRRPEAGAPSTVALPTFPEDRVPETPNPTLALQPRVLPRETAKKASPLRDSLHHSPKQDNEAETSVAERPQASPLSFSQPQSESADPFDPEVFNRRQQTKK